jgi:hypothetical protein
MVEGETTLRLDQIEALEAKIRLEREEPNGKFLLYSPAEEPEYEDDWLLDIRLYSRSFRADKASILLQELGLVNQHLRAHFADRRKFFDSKERLQKIKNLIAPDDVAGDLDRKMIAVVAKADQPELFNLVRTIFHASTESGSEIDLDNPPAIWGQIEKFDLDTPFRQMIKSTFGYEEENPTLQKFPLRLVITDYAHHLKGDVPQSFRGLLPPRNGCSNAVVCLAQWRDSNSKGASYDRLSAEAAAVLKIDEHLPNMEIDQLLNVMTFLAVEKRIAVKHTVSGLLKLLYPNEEYDKEAVRLCLEYAHEARRRVKERLIDHVRPVTSRRRGSRACSAWVPDVRRPGAGNPESLPVERPTPHTSGEFMKRFFDSVYANSFFETLSTGLTRVGLGQYEIDNVALAIPPISEQIMISYFLDSETEKMDSLIAEARRAIDLLQERRTALISSAVTGKINAFGLGKSEEAA